MLALYLKSFFEVFYFHPCQIVNVTLKKRHKNDLSTQSFTKCNQLCEVE